ncbi:S-layer homology domain-containing protein [Arthrobacter cavernae]|uniref:S-layer homology domain-containing protein n=1 Tax=Arthrobacter cavernae TaxID=2817681 RepID=A0A939KIB7_9MICC|nr:S-layer homology domain-containing protein [Arthrobacter cavernae]MBO1266474.1 S-layer homology domain-containing protein [Arthrobacter cavernae]
MSVPAHALPETGPIDPFHGYPAWYTDSAGVQLELCLEGPLCLASGELPNPEAPVSPPGGGNFPPESFWWAGEAAITTDTTDALLVLAQEAAFTTEEAVNGEQIAFNRVRIRVNGLDFGASYTVTHPYGSAVFVAEDDGVGGGKINNTVDIGCFATPCSQADFGLALPSKPFLRWDPAVGPAAPAGFIGDPTVDHEVVGSPTGNNFFRVVGPNVGGPGVNAIQTNMFAIQGKLAGPFTDVPTNHQFATEITWMKDQGITTGFPNGTFQPLGSVSRAAMAAFMFRFSTDSAAFVPPAVSPFTDVPTNHQFYKEITWLKSKGITTGFTPTTFAPQMAVNRKDMAAFIYRLAGEPAFTAPAVSPFTDMTPTSQFFKEVSWLSTTGITTGFPDNTFHPFEDVHRDATAAFLFRFDQAFGAPPLP